MQGQPATDTAIPFSYSFSYGITDLQYMQDNLKIEGGTLVVAGYDTKYSQLLSAIRARSPLPT